MPKDNPRRSTKARKKAPPPDPADDFATAYWRLWRRNWRPPFTYEDRPMPEPQRKPSLRRRRSAPEETPQ